MAAIRTPKFALRLAIILIAIVAIGVAIVFQFAIKADTVQTVINNKASVSYQTNGASRTKVSNNVATIIEPNEPSPTATPTPAPAGAIITKSEGTRVTLQRFMLSAITTEKTVVTFVYDYYPKDKSLPTADSTVKTSRRLQLNSGNRLVHTSDQNGNANQYVVGYFEAKVGSQVVERSSYYYLDTAVGSTLTPLP